MGVRNFFFGSGTQPLVPGSQMCLNITIIDDQLIEPTERFMICGRSSQNAVLILNNGCSDVNIRDNDGESRHQLNYIHLCLATPIVVISPPSPDGVYTVEVQRTLIITCTGANPDDIVAWIRKHSIVAILLCSILFFLCT